MEPFGCADKSAEKHCWLICCERKILFQLKKQAEKTNYKPNEQSQGDPLLPFTFCVRPCLDAKTFGIWLL
jgi:hypothetical protein